MIFSFHFLHLYEPKINDMTLKYYRDAVNHYYEAYAFSLRIQPKDDDFVPTPEELIEADDEPFYTLKELDKMRSVICSNCALAHMCLKNWGFVRDEAKRVSFRMICEFVLIFCCCKYRCSREN